MDPDLIGMKISPNPSLPKRGTLIHIIVDLLIIYKPINKKPDLQKKDRGFFNITLHSLPPKTHREVHSGRFSGLRIILIPAPSHPELVEGQWLLAGFVPDYSGVAVPDSHGVPF